MLLEKFFEDKQTPVMMLDDEVQYELAVWEESDGCCWIASKGYASIVLSKRFLPKRIYAPNALLLPLPETLPSIFVAESSNHFMLYSRRYVRASNVRD